MADVLKRARQQAISDLVRDGTMRTQAELVSALREKGYRVTQATVSRDITELGLVKVGRDGGGRAYALPSSEAAAELTGERRLSSILTDLPVDIHASGTLLVIRAVPGTAHAIAAALDRMRWPGALGSIAGDDTVFVACSDEAAVRRLRQRLLRLGR
jgi:transcriptional regulator of arginine metabolism